MKIKHLHINERPREKLISHGRQVLSDIELLAVIIRSGCRGLSSIELARDMINTFGSLHELFIAPKQKVLNIKGVGPSTYAILNACVEVHTRSLQQKIAKKATFSNVDDVSVYLRSKLSHYKKEVFAVLMLDSQHQFLSYREMFFGTINAAAVYPREIAKQSLEDNACAIILAHNHPSGVAEPSSSDINITRVIQQTVKLIDVSVLDHIIVGHDHVVSMARRGLME